MKRPAVARLIAMLILCPLAGKAAAAPLPPGCAHEAAVLRHAIILRQRPAAHATVLTRLPAGRPVYLCGRRGGWARIAFPRHGERANCAYRRAASRCPIGWVRGRAPVRNVD